MLKTRLARPIGDVKPHYDAVVVGSGYGGGVAASRLARAGLRVAVLERGREVTTGEFPNRFSELMAELQISGKGAKRGSRTGMFDIRIGDDMHVMVGCGLGGGSLVNAGVAVRPDPAVLADAAWPREIERDGLIEEGFARACTWLRPEVHEDAADMAKFQAFDKAVHSLSKHAHKAPVVISFTEGVNAAGVAQPACTLCGDCCAGCNVGAKNTVSLTYLADASRGGAELFTHAYVRRIERARAEEADGRWRLIVEPVADRPAPPLAISTNIIILSAGTLGSTEILLRSREAGLPLSDQLGAHFSANGDAIAFGYGARDTVNAVGVGAPSKVPGIHIGASVSGHVTVEDGEGFARTVLLSEGAVPSAMAPALPLMFLPNGRILGALKSLVNGVYNGPFKSLQTFFAVSHDSASGRLRLSDGRLKLSWPGARDEPAFARIDAILSAVTSASGSSYVKNPLAGTLSGDQPTTAHPLGGCAMAKDRTTGVVNHKSQVFDASPGADAADVHKGLYVVDGSIIPRSLGVNPLLTITALAERALILLATDHGLAFDAEPIHAALPAGAAGTADKQTVRQTTAGGA